MYADFEDEIYLSFLVATLFIGYEPINILERDGCFI